MKSPLLIRAMIIAGVGILVLFPIALISGKISEGRARADAVMAHEDRPRVWKNAYLVVAVSVPRDVKNAKSITSAALNQGKDMEFEGRFAIREDLGEYRSRKAGSTLPFGYQRDITGTSSLFIAPVGDSTEIQLTSSWPHPSFSGAWTPDERH